MPLHSRRVLFDRDLYFPMYNAIDYVFISTFFYFDLISTRDVMRRHTSSFPFISLLSRGESLLLDTSTTVNIDVFDVLQLHPRDELTAIALGLENYIGTRCFDILCSAYQFAAVWHHNNMVIFCDLLAIYFDIVNEWKLHALTTRTAIMLLCKHVTINYILSRFYGELCCWQLSH